MAENASRVMVFPDGNSGNSGNVPAWVLPFMGNNSWGGGNFGGNGWGGGILGFLLGLMFGGNGFGNFFGGNGFGGGNGTGFLSNQIDIQGLREILMNAVNSRGELMQQSVNQLATTLNADFNMVFTAVLGIQTTLCNMSGQLGMSTQQIINAISTGDLSLQNMFCQSLGQLQSTVQQGFSSIQTQMAINQGQEELGRCKQTYEVVQAGNGNTQAILAELRNMQTQSLQDKLEKARDENGILRGQISNDNQTKQFGQMLSSMIAPIVARQQVIDDKVDGIIGKMPNTVPVQWPQLTAVNTTPYVNGGFYGGWNGFGGNGFFGNNINF